MKTKLKIEASLTIVQTLLMGTTIASAQNERVVNDSWLNENYTKREVMVEVRDGEKIYTARYNSLSGDSSFIL
jgi:predicted acyl esterase